MQLSDARILLTGATGGLGEELARQLARAGARILLAGRDAARLATVDDALEGPHATIRAELTRPEGIAATVDAAREFGVNVLINNAGIGSFGMFEQQDWPSVEQILATNLEAPMRLTHAMLPLLRSRRKRRSSASAPRSAACRSPALSPTRPPKPDCAASRRRCAGN